MAVIGNRLHVNFYARLRSELSKDLDLHGDHALIDQIADGLSVPFWAIGIYYMNAGSLR